jgi:hypothetical protein
MSAIDCVLSIHIAHAQERIIVLLSHQLYLVHTCVRTEAYLTGLIVSVSGATGNVVSGDAQIVEAVFDLDQGVKVRKHLKLLSWQL